jgi:CTD small phosphatase-like protein 2
VNIRPHAKEVLERLSREFEVGIFTASKASYARAVVGHLDPKGEYVDFMLFREHCVVREGNIHVKDLRVI